MTASAFLAIAVYMFCSLWLSGTVNPVGFYRKAIYVLNSWEYDAVSILKRNT